MSDHDGKHGGFLCSIEPYNGVQRALARVGDDKEQPPPTPPSPTALRTTLGLFLIFIYF